MHLQIAVSQRPSRIPPKPGTIQLQRFQVLTRDYRGPLIIAGPWIPDARIGETREFDTRE
jgi:hypothetical protein